MAVSAAEVSGSWVRTVLNTAGEPEREAKSRLFNAVEGIGIYLMVLITLWPFCFLFGKIMGSEFALKAANAPLVLGALFLLFVSPFIHRDTAESWGVGNPRRLWQLLHESALPKRLFILGMMATLMIVLNYANYLRWPDVAKFIGLRDTVVMEFTDTAKHPFGLFFVIPFGLLISSLLVTCAIRYDNFGTAFATALKISLPLMAMAFVGAYAAGGWNAFRGFDPRLYALGVFGYVFWGAVQQLLFSSYFGTRMRKAFGPSTSPGNSIPKAQRWLVALKIGAGVSVALALGGYATCHGVYGAEQAPPTLILWFLGVSLPFVTAWGYFYACDKKRMLVATLCGSFFGLIHIDSYGLVIVTFLLGIMLVYAFMEEKNRNLVALGFVHGLLGSTFGWLFDKNGEGALHVDYSVGPWNIRPVLDANGIALPYPIFGTLVVPLLCIAGYLALLVWCLNNIKEDDGHAA